MSLANALGIPLGAKTKKFETSGSGSSLKEDLPPQVAVISEITRDDICLTDSPFFYSSKRIRLGKQLKTKLETLINSFNEIARSVAFDLLTEGYSVYKFRVVEGRYFFEPVIEPCEFYLLDNRIICVIDEKAVDDLIVFINYEKRDLTTKDFDNKKVLSVKPVGFQTRYTEDVLNKLKAAEDSLSRLRAQTRYIRFATVEVGLNKGDQQQAVS